jgi:hypothetical protein
MNMTVNVWNKIEQLAKNIEARFVATGEPITSKVHEYNWYNALYDSPRYRRAHIEIVDNRESHKLYILHCTIFPHFNDPSPIWGFDAVCGPNKITGAFHDFSHAGDPTSFMYLWFKAKVHGLEWNKPRQLPEWAQQIFSPAMVAAGNLQDETEIDQLCNTALTTLDFYLSKVGNDQQDTADFHMAQNRYCHYQKQNPHVIRSMTSMGVPEDTMKQFVNEILFPEIS